MAKRPCATLVRDSHELVIPVAKLKHAVNSIIGLNENIFDGLSPEKVLQGIYNETGVESKLELCVKCARKIGTMRCKRCSARYCGRECQVQHWGVHKEECKKSEKGEGALICGMCGEAGTMRCKKCSARYCGRECQVQHWPVHKAECKMNMVD